MRILLWRAVLALWVLIGGLLCRVRATGGQQLPKSGAFLLLSNHTTRLDPGWIAWKVGRPVYFSTSQGLVRLPLMGLVARALGRMTGNRFDFDTVDRENIRREYAQGRVIAVFPEGQTTWDGRQNPISPAVGGLIQELNARVVFCRIKTGHLFKPRWARWPRWVSVEVEYDPPLRFPEDWSPEQVETEISKRLTIDPRVSPSGLSFGFHATQGITRLLFACPRCFERGTLRHPTWWRSHVRCTKCVARWRLTTANRLVAKTPSTESMHLIDAVERLRESFGEDAPALDDREA